MRKFEFAPSRKNSFTGFEFYETYKNSAFLRDTENINRILGEAFQLRQGIKDLQPGETLQVAGMDVQPGRPLAVKKAGPNVVLRDTDFTMNRLTGLVAAYVFENRKNYPNIECVDAKMLGLTWNNQDGAKAKLYLSCVSGADHFLDQFSFIPLICALRKVHLGNMTVEFLTKTSKIKNQNGTTMKQMLHSNFQEAKLYWSCFPGSTPNEFRIALTKLEK